MSEEDKTNLEFYSKLNKKLKTILNGEMSLEQYQKGVELKIEMILEREESKLNRAGKRLYNRPQKAG
jgi:hypothetical protein